MGYQPSGPEKYSEPPQSVSAIIPFNERLMYWDRNKTDASNIEALDRALKWIADDDGSGTFEIKMANGSHTLYRYGDTDPIGYFDEQGYYHSLEPEKPEPCYDTPRIDYPTMESIDNASR